MYRLYGFPTQNNKKVFYVLEELGLDYEYKFVDLAKGENRTEEFLKLNPFGKLPTLQHNDEAIFESGAIVRYVANVANSPLYPENKLERAHVDQWLDSFSCHLGRWLSTIFFEKIIKSTFGMGAPDEKTCKEAEKFAHIQLKVVNQWLGDRKFLTGDNLSIADLFGFAYIEQTSAIDYSLEKYPNVKRWFAEIEKRDSIKRARARFE